MSESVEVASSSVEWQASSVAADVGSATHEVITAVELDMLADATTPATTTTTADGLDNGIDRAEEEAQLLQIDAALSDETRLECKYAAMALPASDVGAHARDGESNSNSNSNNNEEDDVIIAPLTASALNQQQQARGKLPAVRRGQKRTREAGNSAKAEDPAEVAFRHSQKALRKEALNLSLKDVLGRSLEAHAISSQSAFPSSPPTLQASGQQNVAAGMTGGHGSGSFASPTTPSASSPTAWSPLMVTDITSRFLASVEHQRKQTLEKLISKELSQHGKASSSTGAGRRLTPGTVAATAVGVSRSQPALSPGSPLGIGGGASSLTVSLPDILDDELVIGDEDDNDMNWMPVTPSSDYSGRFARAIHAVDEASEVSRSGLHGGGGGLLSELTTGTQHSVASARPADDAEVTAAEEARRRKREADQKRDEEETSHALSRKHEMWKLKQRQARAQRLVDQDARAKATQQMAATAGSGKAQTSLSGSAHTHAQDSPGKERLEFFRRVVNPTLTPSASQTGEPDGNSMSQGLAGTTSIAKSSLSVEDITMIRRANNYENVSSQNVMVFTTNSSGASAGAGGKKSTSS